MPTTPTLDASTPATVQGSTATTSTAAFIPPAGSWIVVSVQADANNASTDERVTVSTTQTGVNFFCAVFLTGVAAATEIWAAYVGTSASMTVDVTDNKGAVAKRVTPRVYRDMGGIGATATIASAISISYTATAENSLGIASGLASNVLPTAGTGCTVIDETTGFDSGDSAYTVGRTTSLGTLPGSTVTLSVTGPTGVRLVAVELLPTVVGPPPQPLPPWLLQQILVARKAQETSAGVVGPVTIQATADLVGAGALTANVTQITAGTSLAGAGAVAANATVAAVATMTGAGALTANVTKIAPATMTGAGALSALVTEIAVATPTGAGSVVANVTRVTTAALVGAGVITPLATLIAPVTAVGAGSLSAPATTVAPASMAGAGSLSALVTEIAVATPTGAGVLTATGTAGGTTIQGTASLVGAGALTATATLQAGATLAGIGTLGTVTRQVATAVLTGAGVLVATSVAQPTAAVGKVDSVGHPLAMLDASGSSRSEAESTRKATGSLDGQSSSTVAAEGISRTVGSHE
jgi:hypothetical protein